MSFAQKAFVAVRWNAVEQIVTQAIQLVVFFILARLVAKEAFGLIALTSVFCAFFLIFARKGFDDAIIQRAELSELSMHTAFWSSAAFGFLLSVLCVATSPLLALVYGEPRIIAVLSVLSLNLFFGSLSAVPVAILRREMSFRPLALRSIAARGIAGAIGVAMAYQGFGVWSLVASQVCGELLSLVFLWGACSYRPKFRFCLEECRRYVDFGGRIIVSQIMNFFNRRYDTLIIGKFFGLEVLGIYAISMKLIDFCVYTFMGVTGQVGYPVMCRLKESSEKFQKFTKTLVVLIAGLVTPAVMVLVFFPDIWMDLLFGPKWAEAIPTISLLAPLLLVKLTSWTEVLGITAMGRPDCRMHLAMLFAMISVSLLTFGAFLGLQWLVLFASLRYFIMAVPTSWTFCRISGVNLGSLIRMQFLPVLGGFILFAAAYHLQRHAVGVWYEIFLQMVAGLLYIGWLFWVLRRDEGFMVGCQMLLRRFVAVR